MKKLHTVLATVSILLMVFVEDPPEVSNRMEVRVLSVIDGDTYWVEPVDNRMLVRLANADTWESRRVRRAGFGPISDEEIAKGRVAKGAVEALLSSGRVYLDTKPSKDGEAISRDSFGRVLGTVKVYQIGDSRLVDVGQWLSANGHTRLPIP